MPLGGDCSPFHASPVLAAGVFVSFGTPMRLLRLQPVSSSKLHLPCDLATVDVPPICAHQFRRDSRGRWQTLWLWIAIVMTLIENSFHEQLEAWSPPPTHRISACVADPQHKQIVCCRKPPVAWTTTTPSPPPAQPGPVPRWTPLSAPPLVATWRRAVSPVSRTDRSRSIWSLAAWKSGRGVVIVAGFPCDGRTAATKRAGGRQF